MTKQFFFYRKDGALKRINLQEIVCMETANNYVRFIAYDYTILVRTSLDTALSQLPKDQFVQIHRSYAVSVEHIETVGKDFVSLVSAPDHTLPVSKKFYATLIKRITIIEAASGDAGNQE